MATETVQNIRKDIKLLITAITGFKEVDPGFRTCEKFALSKINSYAYPTVNPQQTKKDVTEIIDKMMIHGKEDVANKFRQLVDTFLTSFDFDKHPQSDLQWSLLTLLLNLSRETRNSYVSSLNQSSSLNDSISSSSETNPEEIDWVEYLKEGSQDFFCNFSSDTESEWSNDEIEENVEDTAKVSNICEVQVERGEQNSRNHDLLQRLKEENISKSWLTSNIQNNWWNELDWNQCEVTSKFFSANYSEFWRKNVIKSTHIIGTVSEFKVIRELLWMLVNPSQTVLFEQDEKMHFHVRDNVTIPSLSVVAFKSILQPYCEYFSMIYELEHFGESLYQICDDTKMGCPKKEPPLTYQTYDETLRTHISEIKEEIIQLEKSVMQQDQIHTLLTITSALNNVLRKVKMLYKVHKTIIDDLSVVSNDNAVAKLLSGIYFHIESAITKEEMYMYMSLYLSSITVYLNIIDTWMREGRLEDWREEFLIKRNTDDFSFDEGFHTERFSVKPVNPAYTTDPLIKIILQKVCQMGRNIDLLVTLGRMSELRKSTHDTCIRTSLSNRFQDELLFELSKLKGETDKDNMDFAEQNIVTVENDLNDSEEDNGMIQVVASKLLQTDNLFLWTAFEDYLKIPTNIEKLDFVDGSYKKLQDAGQFKKQKLKNVLDPIVPVRKIIEQTLTKILDEKYQKMSTLVKHILMNQYKLEEHLKLMRCIYMMETSHIINRFIYQFFSQVENGSLWCNSSVLTRNLEEVLSEKWPETSSRWSVSVNGLQSFNQVLQAIDGINLHYAIGWPINLLLHEAALAKYNSIFKFNLKLKWALWTLNNLKFSDIEGSRSNNITSYRQQFFAKRLECLRFWLLHAIGSIHSYLCGQVLQSLAYVLQNALTQAEDLDTIINLHDEFLDKVHEHCLQTDQFVELRDIINNLFELCIQIKKRWIRGFKSITGSELDVLEKNYVKYHTCLALALHNAAAEYDNAESLTILESAFTCSMPEA